MRAELEQFFEPKSVAIVGVSKGGFRFGGMSFLRKLQEAGFRGKIYPINPKAEELGGLRAYPNLSSLPEVPDLGIVCVAARLVPSVLEECGRVGLRHVHVLTAGFRETATQEGIELEARIQSISRERGLLVIGPNCMGPYSPSVGLTAWGAIPGSSGPLGIVSQSGAITQRLTEYALSLGVGTHKAVSFGNAAVLDEADFVELMAADPKIRVLKSKKQAKPTVFSIDSGGGDPELAQQGAALRAQLCSAGIPAYPAARRAARALERLHRYHAFRRAHFG